MEQTDRVSQRFTLSSHLGAVSTLAILFATLRAFAADPQIYLYLGSLTLLISAMHIRDRNPPLDASITAGAISVPLFFVISLIWAMLVDHTKLTKSDFLIYVGAGLCSLIPGAFLGLLIGWYVRICMMLTRLSTGDKIENRRK